MAHSSSTAKVTCSRSGKPPDSTTPLSHPSGGRRWALLLRTAGTRPFAMPPLRHAASTTKPRQPRSAAAWTPRRSRNPRIARRWPVSPRYAQHDESEGGGRRGSQADGEYGQFSFSPNTARATFAGSVVTSRFWARSPITFRHGNSSCNGFVAHGFCHNVRSALATSHGLVCLAVRTADRRVTCGSPPRCHSPQLLDEDQKRGMFTDNAQPLFGRLAQPPA